MPARGGCAVATRDGIEMHLGVVARRSPHEWDLPVRRGRRRPRRAWRSAGAEVHEPGATTGGRHNGPVFDPDGNFIRSAGQRDGIARRQAGPDAKPVPPSCAAGPLAARGAGPAAAGCHDGVDIRSDGDDMLPGPRLAAAAAGASSRAHQGEARQQKHGADQSTLGTGHIDTPQKLAITLDNPSSADPKPHNGHRQAATSHTVHTREGRAANASRRTVR